MGLTLGDFEQMAGAPEVQGKNSDTERKRGECNLHRFHLAHHTFSFLSQDGYRFVVGRPVAHIMVLPRLVQ